MAFSGHLWGPPEPNLIPAFKKAAIQAVFFGICPENGYFFLARKIQTIYF
jgi:hypothetical protein